MQRIHPEFMNFDKRALDEAPQLVELIIEQGTQYWANVLMREIGPVTVREAPLIIAALGLAKEAIEKTCPPEASRAADEIRKNVHAMAVVKEQVSK